MRQHAVIASLAGMLAALCLPQIVLEAHAQGGGLLPQVVVTRAGQLETLDWSRLRTMSGSDYPSRWDDLTLIDSCLWIPAEELAERLGFSVRLEARRQDFQCKYWAYLPNGDSGIVLSVYVELHDSAEYPADSEKSFNSGVSGMQFKEFDVGVDDLNVYVNDRGQYLYVFPKGGRTMWSLTYKPHYGMENAYLSQDGAIRSEDIGREFMALLIEKYETRL